MRLLKKMSLSAMIAIMILNMNCSNVKAASEYQMMNQEIVVGTVYTGKADGKDNGKKVGSYILNLSLPSYVNMQLDSKPVNNAQFGNMPLFDRAAFYLTVEGEKKGSIIDALKTGRSFDDFPLIPDSKFVLAPGKYKVNVYYTGHDAASYGFRVSSKTLLANSLNKNNASIVKLGVPFYDYFAQRADFKDDAIHTYMFEVTGKDDTHINIECEDEADAVTFRLYKYDKQLNKLATMRFNNDNKIAINSKLLGGIYYIEAEQQGRKGAAYKLLIE